MAMQRTGGEKTDELLGKGGGGPEGLPHSIIVTPEGVEGEVPGVIAEARAPVAAPAGAPEAPAAAKPPRTGKASRAPGRRKGRAAKAAAPKRGKHGRRGKA